MSVDWTTTGSLAETTSATIGFDSMGTLDVDLILLTSEIP